MRWILILAGVVCLHTSGLAEPRVGDMKDLSLPAALSRVLQDNPQLKAMDYAVEAAGRRVEQQQQTSPWRVGLQLENVVGSGVYSSSDRLESTLSLGKVLELGNKPERRAEVAQLRSGVLRDQQSAQQLDIVAEASRRYLRALTLQHRIALIEETRQIREQTLQSVVRRVDAGRSPTAERYRANIALERSALQLQRLRKDRDIARLQLAGMWGDSTAAFGKLTGALYDLQPPESFETLKARLQDNPHIVQFATRQRLAEARYRLAQSRRSLDLQMRGGVRHQRQTDDTALLFSFSLPLGSASRAQPYIEEARQLRQQQPYAAQQQRLELIAALHEAYQEMRYAYQAMQRLQQRIIPDAQRALRDYRRGYENGRYSLLELNDAQQSLIDGQLQKIATAATYHRARVEIERLTGTAVQTGVSQ